MNPPGPLRSLAATARLANIPSVLSNVTVGIVLGTLANKHVMVSGCWLASAAAGISAVLLYLGGNFLNDWADRNWDARRRPERALPRGLFSPAIYLAVAAGMLLAGLGAAASVNSACLGIALAIVICILLYTWLHKRTAWSVIPLAQCRALLPLIGFVAIASLGESRFGMVARCAGLGLFCHVIGLSLFARHETSTVPLLASRHPASVLFLLASLASFSSARYFLELPLFACLAGLAPYGLWMIFSLSRSRHTGSTRVSRMLAGMPLVDWMLLLPLFFARDTFHMPAMAAAACLSLPPLAVMAGKFLQRLAPAT